MFLKHRPECSLLLVGAIITVWEVVCICICCCFCCCNILPYVGFVRRLVAASVPFVAVPALVVVLAFFVPVEASYFLAQLALYEKPTPPSSALIHYGYFPQDTRGHQNFFFASFLLLGVITHFSSDSSKSEWSASFFVLPHVFMALSLIFRAFSLSLFSDILVLDVCSELKDCKNSTNSSSRISFHNNNNLYSCPEIIIV